jgi:hypothetical protein
MTRKVASTGAVVMKGWYCFLLLGQTASDSTRLWRRAAKNETILLKKGSPDCAGSVVQNWSIVLNLSSRSMKEDGPSHGIMMIPRTGLSVRWRLELVICHLAASRRTQSMIGGCSRVVYRRTHQNTEYFHVLAASFRHSGARKAISMFRDRFMSTEILSVPSEQRMAAVIRRSASRHPVLPVQVEGAKRSSRADGTYSVVWCRLWQRGRFRMKGGRLGSTKMGLVIGYRSAMCSLGVSHVWIRL